MTQGVSLKRGITHQLTMTVTTVPVLVLERSLPSGSQSTAQEEVHSILLQSAR